MQSRSKTKLIPLFTLLIFLCKFPSIVLASEMECFYYDPRNVSLIKTKKGPSKMHLLNDTILYSEVGPYFLSYMAMDQKTQVKNSTKELIAYYKTGRAIKTHLVEFHSMFVGYDGSFGYNDKYYSVEYGGIWRQNIPGPYVGEVDEVIVLGHSGGYNNFGHMFQDIIQPLILIPDEIKNRSMILMNFMRAGRDFIDLWGFRKEQQLFLKRGEWVHASRMHTIISPSAFLTHYAETVLKLKRFLHEKLQLDKIEATDYCFINRCKKCSRYIQNLDEIMNATQLAFPTIEFKKMNDFVGSIYDVQKTWAKVKFVFAPTGSIVLKGYFMKDNSVIVSVATPWGDRAVVILNSMNKIFVLQFVAKEMDHWKGNGSNVSVSDSLRCIEAGLFCVKNQKWPSEFINGNIALTAKK